MRAWIVGSLLEVLGGNHAAELKVIIDDENLFDSVAMQQRQHFILVGTFPHGHKLFLRRHDRRYGRL